MASWTRQPGFPLITIERNYDDKTDQVTLSQERYIPSTPWIRDHTTWWVPYNLATPSKPGFSNTRAEGWIPQNSTSLDIIVDSLGSNDYLLFNKIAAGYYRVMYDERNYRLISDAIIRNRSLFHSTNIAQLLNDAFVFYQDDRLILTPLLDLLRILEFESDFISWSPALPAITFINRNIRGHRNEPVWADFIRSITEKIYDAVGIERNPNEPLLRSLARRPIIDLACQVGSVHCRSDASRQLRRYMESDDHFDANFIDSVMCASIRSASRTEFHFVWNRVKSLPLSNDFERGSLIFRLGCSRSRPLLHEYIRSSLQSTNSNNVEYTEFERTSVFESILLNGGSIGLDVVFKFVLENAIEASNTYDQFFFVNLSRFARSAEHIEKVI